MPSDESELRHAHILHEVVLCVSQSVWRKLVSSHQSKLNHACLHYVGGFLEGPSERFEKTEDKEDEEEEEDEDDDLVLEKDGEEAEEDGEELGHEAVRRKGSGKR